MIKTMPNITPPLAFLPPVSWIERFAPERIANKGQNNDSNTDKKKQKAESEKCPGLDQVAERQREIIRMTSGAFWNTDGPTRCQEHAQHANPVSKSEDNLLSTFRHLTRMSSGAAGGASTD
jgi:hypothetical protein